MIWRIAHFTNDPRRLLDAVDSIAPTDLPLRRAALAAAAPPTDWAKQYRVVLLSDGASGTDAVPAGMEMLKIGSPRENAGIVACDLQPLPTGKDKLGLYIRLASTFKKPREAYLAIYHDQTYIAERAVAIKPGRNNAQVFHIEGQPGRWKIELDVKDALAKDNVAYMVVPPPRPVRVAVQTKQKFFYEHSVLAFARSGHLLTLAQDDPQVVLAQASPPAGDAPTILFAPEGKSAWWGALGEKLKNVVPRSGSSRIIQLCAMWTSTRSILQGRVVWRCLTMRW